VWVVLTLAWAAHMGDVKLLADALEQNRSAKILSLPIRLTAQQFAQITSGIEAAGILTELRLYGTPTSCSTVSVSRRLCK
jgi:hypothetical protein